MRTSLIATFWYLAVSVSFCIGELKTSALKTSALKAAVPDQRVLEVHVPRDRFAELIREVSTSHRLMPLIDLQRLIDDDFERRHGAWKKSWMEWEEEQARHPLPQVIEDARFTATISPDLESGRIVGEYDLTIHSVDGATIDVPVRNGALEAIRVDDLPANLVKSDSDGVKVRILKPGRHRMSMTMSFPVTIDDYSRRLQATLLPFPRAHIEALLPGSDLEVTVSPGVGTLVTQKGAFTKISSDLAATSELSLSWFTAARHTPVKVVPPDAGLKEDESESRATPAPVTAEPQVPFVRADLCHIVGVSGSDIDGEVVVRYTIDRAPVTRLAIEIPASLGPIRISRGEHWLASHVVESGVLKLKLRAPQEGVVDVGFRYHLNLQGDRSGSKVPVPEIQVQDANVVVGHILVDRLDNVHILADPGPDLESMESVKLPDFVEGFMGDDTLFAYRYLSTPAPLLLTLRSFEDAAVLPAVITNAIASTLFSNSGQALTRLHYQVRNRGYDFLRLELQDDNKIDRVLVDQKRVSPGRDDEGRVLIPLAQNANVERDVLVDVEYRTDRRGRSLWGPLEAALPTVDLPITTLQWRWIVPGDTTLVRSSPKLVRSATPYPDPFAGITHSVGNFKTYSLSKNLIDSGGVVSIKARSLGPRLRLVPMSLLFLVGALMMGLTLNLLLTGRLHRSTISVLALSFLLLESLAGETEVTQPFWGGIHVASWAASLLLAYQFMLALDRGRRSVTERLTKALNPRAGDKSEDFSEDPTTEDSGSSPPQEPLDSKDLNSQAETPTENTTEDKESK